MSLKLFRPSLVRNISTINKITENHHCTFLSGLELSKQLQHSIKDYTKTLSDKPGLGVISVGRSLPSLKLARLLEKACKKAGYNFYKRELSWMCSEQEVKKAVLEMNSNKHIDGIMVQLPLPEHIRPFSILPYMNSRKDIDGLAMINMGYLTQYGHYRSNDGLISDLSFHIPCTPLACLYLIQNNNISIQRKHAVIIGRSNIVGIPLSLLLLHCNMTISIVHDYTKEINNLCKKADLLISCTGCPSLVKDSWIKEGSMVIDIGTTYLNENSFPIGDVDISVKNKADYFVSVPGGIGPLTVSMVLFNTLKAYSMLRNMKCPPLVSVRI